MGWAVRGIRGATAVDRNGSREILEATAELLSEIVRENGINTGDIASAIFTVTPDLDAEFPAAAARKLMGWTQVPMLCCCEISVPGGLERCIRVLVMVNTEKSQLEIHHVYLGKAAALREDLAAR